MTVGQTDFSAAVLDPARAVPDGLTDPQGRAAGKRFSVYRNNVAVSLTEALETAFPVVRKLVGDEFFKAMAGLYLRAHPPASQLMMFYGAQMPTFLEAFQPVTHLGYLPDVARLELALRHSYHAADADPVDPAALQSLPIDRLMSARLTLAPAVHVVGSGWPIAAIWAANMVPGAPKPQMRPEDVLITRPAFDPAQTVLPPGGAGFVGTLQAGLTFAEAVDAAGDGFDLTAALAALLAGNAITAVRED